MTIRTRLALAFAALAVVTALLGAALLHHLSSLHAQVVEAAEPRVAGTTIAAERAGIAATARADRTLVEAHGTLAAFLAGACGLVGLTVWGARTTVRPTGEAPFVADPAPADDRDAAALPAPDSPRNPFIDRRGPDRAANVVRPPFGQRSPGDDAPNGSRPTRADDWEAY